MARAGRALPGPPGDTRGLLAAARDAFLASRYASAGLDAICRQAGVTKGALFHHVDGKEGLAGEVLEERVRAAAEAYAEGPHRRARGAIGRAPGYVDHTIQLCRRAPLGCPIILAGSYPSGGLTPPLDGTYLARTRGTNCQVRAAAHRERRAWRGWLPRGDRGGVPWSAHRPPFLPSRGASRWLP